MSRSVNQDNREAQARERERQAQAQEGLTCQTYDIGGQVVHVNYGPAMEEIVRRSEGEAWCFHCRKRREFFYIVIAPVEPSYYAPNVDIRCGTCNASDGDLFPGREREWDG